MSPGPVSPPLPAVSLEEVPPRESVVQRWIRDRFDVYSRGCLILAAILVPVSVHVGSLDSFALIKLTFLWFLGVVAIALQLSQAVVTRSWRLGSRIGALAVVHLGAVALATVLSSHPLISLLGRYERYNGLITLALYVAIGLVVLVVYRDCPGRLTEIAWASVLASGLASAYVIVQAANLDWWLWASNGRLPEFPAGTLGNSNFAGGYLAVTLPLAVGLLLTGQRLASRLLLGSVVASQVLAIWYTHTRGGILAVLVALAVMGYALAPSRRRLAFITVGAILVVAGLAVLKAVGGPEEAKEGAPRLTSTSTLQNRVYYWRAAAHIAWHNPIVGTGPETFYANYPRIRERSEAEKNPLSLTDKPHNIFLEKASDTGLVGLGSYLALLAGVIWASVLALRDREAAHRTLVVSFLAALVAYLVQGFFSIDVPQLAFMGWLLIGCLAALTEPHQAADHAGTSALPASGSRPVDEASGGTRWPLQLMILSWAVILIGMGTRPLRADVAASDGRVIEAMHLQPWEPRYPSRYAELQQDVAMATADPVAQSSHFEMANRYALEAHRLEPGNTQLVLHIAVINTSWAEVQDSQRFAQATYWWRQALAGERYDPQIRAFAAQARRVLESKASELVGLARARPEALRGWLDAAQAYVALGEPEGAREAVGRASAIAPNDPEVISLVSRLPN